jgi:hypothetical protein
MFHYVHLVDAGERQTLHEFKRPLWRGRMAGMTVGFGVGPVQASRRNLIKGPEFGL